jgi:hypothetical protein
MLKGYCQSWKIMWSKYLPGTISCPRRKIRGLIGIYLHLLEYPVAIKLGPEKNYVVVLRWDEPSIKVKPEIKNCKDKTNTEKKHWINVYIGLNRMTYFRMFTLMMRKVQHILEHCLIAA